MKNPVVFNGGDLVIDASAVVMVEKSAKNMTAIYCTGWEEPCLVESTMQHTLKTLGIAVVSTTEEVPNETPLS